MTKKEGDKKRAERQNTNYFVVRLWRTSNDNKIKNITKRQARKPVFYFY